jgi:hypothetical protein
MIIDDDFKLLLTFTAVIIFAALIVALVFFKL